MARTSTAQLFQEAYDKTKDFVDTVTDESRTMYDEARRWVPKHPTAAALSASAVVSVGLFAYALGRRRRAPERGTVSAAIAKAPELDLSPFFRFLKLWMIYRVATMD